MTAEEFKSKFSVLCEGRRVYGTAQLSPVNMESIANALSESEITAKMARDNVRVVKLYIQAPGIHELAVGTGGYYSVRPMK